jgi:hypothetical protein
MNSIVQTTFQVKLLVAVMAILGVIVAATGWVYHEQEQHKREYRQELRKAPQTDPKIGDSMKKADY